MRSSMKILERIYIGAWFLNINLCKGFPAVGGADSGTEQGDPVGELHAQARQRAHHQGDTGSILFFCPMYVILGIRIKVHSPQFCLI